MSHKKTPNKILQQTRLRNPSKPSLSHRKTPQNQKNKPLIKQQKPKKNPPIRQISSKNRRKAKKVKKKTCVQDEFLIFSLLSVPSGAIRYWVSPLEYHSLNMKIRRESRTLFPVWLRRTGRNSRDLLRLELTIGLDAGRGFPKAPAKTQ